MKKLGLLFFIFIISCSKSDNEQIQEDPITMIDNSGNTYTTIKIGNAVWTQKNLTATKFLNGDIIPQIQDASTWNSTNSPAWCYYNFDPAYSSYGKFYNWFAASDSRDIAPLGWHVASKSEFESLSQILGGDTVAGGKLKSTNLNDWSTPNTGATNQSQFSAIGVGIINENGLFENSFGKYAGFWTQTSHETNYFLGYSAKLYYDSSVITNGAEDRKKGYAIRCVKNY